MSIQEVVHRCIRLARYLTESIIYRNGWVSLSSVRVSSASRGLIQCDGVECLITAEKFPDHLLQYRHLWLTNTVQLFDAFSKYDLGPDIQWRTDPKTKTITPLQFGRSIDYRDEQCVGEIKYLWELGRHQFLVPMAIRASFGKDAQVRAKLESFLSSWLDQNPIGMGIHWCSSLELALRLISWSFIHSILHAGGMKNGIFDLNCNTELLKAHIYSQAKFIVRNYSRHSSSNNHLIGELTGVWITCNVFDLGPKGTNWRESSFVELEREIQLQTHEDGVNKEQAIYYHLWSLEYFWLAWAVAKRYEHSVSEIFEERIVAMYLFLDAMCASTDFPSQIGDSDNGVAARFSPDISENVFHSLLAPMSLVLEGEQEGLCDSLYTKLFWYQQIVKHTDASSLVSIYKRKQSELPLQDSFESGGYYVFQGQDCRLMYKAGPFGYLSTGAHGHADALSVTLAINGQWWLIDPGTYTYHSAGEWRDYFRSTAAHNTLCINQKNQSNIGGDFLWSKKTDAHVRCVERGANVSGQYLSQVCGYHYGYSDLGVEHERTVKCDGVGTFELIDLVKLSEGVEGCDLQLAFHFHPDVILQRLDSHRWVATRLCSTSSLTIKLPVQFNWYLKNGSVSPILGWYSETYGIKKPSNTLIGHTKSNYSNCAEHSYYRTLLEIHDSRCSAASDGVVGVQN